MNGLRAAGWAATATGVAGALAAAILPHGAPPALRGDGGATFASIRHRLVVTSLRTGGGAAAAGLRVGDVIESANGLPVATPAALAAAARGGAVILRVTRQGAPGPVTLLEPARETRRDQDPAGRR